MKNEVYDKLAAALNARGMTYPSVPCDEFYTLIAELFSPEQAEIATHMPLEPVSEQELTEKIKGSDASKLNGQLDEMASRGLVRVKEKSGKRLYELMPFVPGIIELQFMHGRADERTKRLAQLFKNYAKAMRNIMLTMPAPTAAAEPKAARKISVDKEVEHRSTVLPYDEVIKLIDKTEYVAAGTCVCRHQGDLLDKPCDKPKENLCMILGPSAKFAESHKFVRLISKEEARARIDEAEEAGLVHNYANSQDRYIDLLCNCCGCHCLILRTTKRSPIPSQAVIADWVMTIDHDACIGCEACISRCWMDALIMDGDAPARDFNRCIGCGVCAYVCPTDAMKLVKRETAKA